MEQEKMLKEDTLEDEFITVLVVEPMKPAYVKKISIDYQAMQKEVGGDIESLAPFKEQVELVMNAEGKRCHLPLNREIYDEEGKLWDVIAGTFLVVGVTEYDFGSLTPDQVEKYMEKFRVPQIFAYLNGRMVAVPATFPDKPSEKEEKPKVEQKRKGKKRRKEKTGYER